MLDFWQFYKASLSLFPHRFQSVMDVDPHSAIMLLLPLRKGVSKSVFLCLTPSLHFVYVYFFHSQYQPISQLHEWKQLVPPQSTSCGLSLMNPMEESFPTSYICEFYPLIACLQFTCSCYTHYCRIMCLRAEILWSTTTRAHQGI